MRREREGGAVGIGLVDENAALRGEDGVGDTGLLGQMIQILLQEADAPPREVEGVSEEFCDGTVIIPQLRLPSLLLQPKTQSVD